MRKNKDYAKAVKIEGRAFDRIKAKIETKKTAMEGLMKAIKEAQADLWKTIHEEFPELDEDANLTIDTEHEDLGFYVVKEKDGMPSGLLSALKATLS